MNTTINNYKIKIIRKKIKHTYIRVKNETIVVTTNYLTPKIYINKLIKDNKKTIEQMIIKDKKNQELEKDFYLFGKKYDIIYDNSIPKITFNDNKIIIKNEKELNNYIENIIKDIYLKHLNSWYNKFEENIPYPNLKIRKMKTRWGVCNIKNHNVTLNYYLYKYDLDCLDYVIVHELSHFLEANHSKNFWQVVSKYYPNYKEIKNKLRS